VPQQWMVGEVDSRETADAVKRFCLELRGSRKLPKYKESPFGLSVSKMRGALFLERVGRR
jgi:hypothetical protein